MENSKEQKVIGVMTDSKFNFQGHINKFCKKPSQKVAALLTLSSYLHTFRKI